MDEKVMKQDREAHKTELLKKQEEILRNNLANSFDEKDDLSSYWTDGNAVFYRYYGSIRDANIETFIQFSGGWAKDKNHCYVVGNKLKNSDPNSFKVLNIAYAKDQENVWAFGGRIAEADAATFKICDDGRYSLVRSDFKQLPNGQIIFHVNFNPYGFGKDKNAVYYYDFQGKPKLLKKAIPSSFVSLNDGHFGFDENMVFCGNAALPKANPKTWTKFVEGQDYYYSKDNTRVYYSNRLIKDADAETFKAIIVPNITRIPFPYAKDKNRGYYTDRAIELSELEKIVLKHIEWDKQLRIKWGLLST